MTYYALGYIDAESNRKVMPERSRAQTFKQRSAWSVKLFGLLSVVAVLMLVGMLVDTVNASASQATRDGLESTAHTWNADGGNAALAEMQHIDEQVIIVQAGDTLWKIARDHKPADMKIRAYLEELKYLNGLEDSIIQEGMLLKLPE